MNMYKELIIWKDSIELIKLIYNYADKLPKSEEYNLKLQLKKAAISIALNIAEGKNRRTARDFNNFLTIAVSSLSEVETILEICEELNFFKIEESLKEKVTALGKKINALKRKLLIQNK